MPLAATSAYLSLRLVVGPAGCGDWPPSSLGHDRGRGRGVAQGRLGAVVALVLLPPIAAGLWLLATRRSTATSAFATAFASVILGAFAPVLLAWSSSSRCCWPSCAAGFAPTPSSSPWSRRRARALARPGRRGLVARRGRRGGLAQWGGSTPEPWQLALLHTGGAGSRWCGPACPLVASRSSRSCAGPRLGLGPRPAADPARARSCSPRPSSRRRSAWAPSRPASRAPASRSPCGPGTLLLPSLVVLVLSLARGLDGIRLSRGVRGGHRAPRHRWTSVTASVPRCSSSPPVASPGPGSAPCSPRGTTPGPPSRSQQAEGAFATRALFVSPGDRGAGYRFVGREAAEVVRPLPVVAEADGEVATRVSAALGDASAGPALFADTATDLLAVRTGVVPEVTRRLDATEGSTRVAPRDGWEMWRVSPTTGRRRARRAAAPAPRDPRRPARRDHRQHAGTRTTVDAPLGSRLVVAEPPRAEHATVTVDGVVLEPVGRRPRPPTPCPSARATSSSPSTTRRGGGTSAQVVAIACLAFLAVPLRSAGAPPGWVGDEPARGPRLRRLTAAPHRRSTRARRAPASTSPASPGSSSWGRRRGPGPRGHGPAARPRPRRRLGRAGDARRRQRPATRVTQICSGPSSPASRASLTSRCPPTSPRQPAPPTSPPSPPGAASPPRPRERPVLLEVDQAGTASAPLRGRARAPHRRGVASPWRSPAPRSGPRGRPTCVASSRRPAARRLRPLAPRGWRGPGRQERLVLTNPGANPVTADVTVHGDAGPLGDPAVETVAPGGGSASSSTPAGDEQHPAVHVRADGGGLTPRSPTPGSAAAPLGAETTGDRSPAPGRSTSCPAAVFGTGPTSLRVVVPGEQDAVVKVTVLAPRTVVPLTGESVLSVAPGASASSPSQGAGRHGCRRHPVRRPRRRLGVQPGRQRQGPGRVRLVGRGHRRCAGRWRRLPGVALVTRTLHLVSTGGSSTARGRQRHRRHPAQPDRGAPGRPRSPPSAPRAPRRCGCGAPAAAGCARRAHRHRGDCGDPVSLGREGRGPDASRPAPPSRTPVTVRHAVSRCLPHPPDPTHPGRPTRTAPSSMPAPPIRRPRQRGERSRAAWAPAVRGRGRCRGRSRAAVPRAALPPAR